METVNIMRKLEICCYSIDSARLAEKSGAHRIELCDNYLEGGTTPSYATIKNTLSALNIPVNIILRPRGGDFLYSKSEYEIIKDDILKIKELGASGIVTGFLLPDGEIDISKTQEVIKLAGNMDVTFHRAFDMCRNPLKALEQLKEIGIARILTSGTNKSAFAGIEMLSDLVKKANNEISIMPGGGINENNLKEIISKTNAKEFHCSAKTFEQSQMQFKNENAYMGRDNNYDEFSKITVNTDSIKKMIKILKNL